MEENLPLMDMAGNDDDDVEIGVEADAVTMDDMLEVEQDSDGTAGVQSKAANSSTKKAKKKSGKGTVALKENSV